ncbi:hypothetical protein TWF481_001392 [Arthrobotrys musiformis]|uniref:non-specific serine/threonine protein kinase n=1 Tax=Arthrobotrys musiformis TaxID=47236 RepID=A0AAV9WQD3_9PEZI
MFGLIRKALRPQLQRSPWLSRLFKPPQDPESTEPPHPSSEDANIANHSVPGGFHPVSLDDKFNSGKYTVLRKLGYGRFSTVWLARDSEAEKFVALKILRADCYDGKKDIFESEILSKITQQSEKSTHPGRRHVSSLLDTFKHEGPNGNHVCYVFDVLGHNLGHHTWQFERARIPFRSVKLITKQVLLALDFLHTECGVIHTDLQPSNMLLELENPEGAIKKYLYETSPRIHPKNGALLHEAISTSDIDTIKEPRIRLIDYGVWNLLEGRKPITISWKELLDGPPPLDRPEGMSDSEVSAYIDFLSNILVIDPSRRKTAAQLLQHEWLQNA